jgi:hypothetical protein
MKVVFMLVDDELVPTQKIKTVRLSRCPVPPVCSNIRLDNSSYHVLAVGYDFDLGIITVNLKNI